MPSDGKGERQLVWKCSCSYIRHPATGQIPVEVKKKEGGVFFILYLQELPLTSPLYFLNKTELLWPAFPSVLGLDGMELTFPTGAHTGLCFALAAGKVLIQHHCLGCR